MTVEDSRFVTSDKQYRRRTEQRNDANSNRDQLKPRGSRLESGIRRRPI